ncbi:hypothetical protein V1264_000623 [Littorina saxatilis]|uniref:Claudin n=2 Tax=Littorina saxatilis TaxID=31220 RepID=A0AAN9BZP7_9CAEN
MSVFSVRSAGYKVGVILLCLATASCLWGYASPYWVSVDLSLSANLTSTSDLGVNLTGKTLNEGLWTYCISERNSKFKCRSYGVEGFPIWFHVARALASVGLLGLIFSCFQALATNCCTGSVDAARTRSLELWVSLFGLLGAGGCAVFVYFRNKTDYEDSQSEGSLSEALWLFYKLEDYTFSWGFYLDVVGSGVSVIAAIIIAVFNKRLDVTRGNAPPNDRGKIFHTEESYLGHSRYQQRMPSGSDPRLASRQSHNYV